MRLKVRPNQQVMEIQLPHVSCGLKPSISNQLDPISTWCQACYQPAIAGVNHSCSSSLLLQLYLKVTYGPHSRTFLEFWCCHSRPEPIVNDNMETPRVQQETPATQTHKTCDVPPVINFIWGCVTTNCSKNSVGEQTLLIFVLGHALGQSEAKHRRQCSRGQPQPRRRSPSTFFPPHAARKTSVWGHRQGTRCVG